MKFASDSVKPYLYICKNRFNVYQQLNCHIDWNRQILPTFKQFRKIANNSQSYSKMWLVESLTLAIKRTYLGTNITQRKAEKNDEIEILLTQSRQKFSIWPTSLSKKNCVALNIKYIEGTSQPKIWSSQPTINGNSTPSNKQFVDWRFREHHGKIVEKSLNIK